MNRSGFGETEFIGVCPVPGACRGQRRTVPNQGWSLVRDGCEAVVVVPVDPFRGGEFDFFDALPWPLMAGPRMHSAL